jgi:hypothetical protein
MDLSRGRDNHFLAKYEDGLSELPPPGQGNGLHSKLLSVANLGVKAGLTAEQMVSDLRRNVPAGDRTVTDSEIKNAVAKSMRDGGRVPADAAATLSVKPIVRPELRDEIIKAGRGCTEEQIRSASPIHIVGDNLLPGHAATLLWKLYDPLEFLFIGTQYDGRVRPVKEWLDLLENGQKLGPHIIPNPMTGKQGLTKDGKPSYRADSCVKSFRFALGEFDNLSMEDQLAFWSAVNLPIAALITSGGKSVHAWIKVDCPDCTTWEAQVERGLFGARLIPLGVDPLCRNEARLSRMPGFYREEKKGWQRLLYLAPHGRRVCG